MNIEFENSSRIRVENPSNDIRGFRPLEFDGETYEPKRDHQRLASQYDRVFKAMRDGRWRTPQEIERLTDCSWASISARLRDMRKEKFGQHRVNREYVGNGLYMYQLLVAPQQMRLV
jgi:hypothetical protein